MAVCFADIVVFLCSVVRGKRWLFVLLILWSFLCSVVRGKRWLFVLLILGE